MPFFSDFLYPELRGSTVHECARRLKLARQTPLDAIELFGMAGGLVAVTGLTRYAGAELDAADRLLAALANFAVALPLLALFLGPFHVRRMRRGLRSYATRNDSAGPASQPD